MNFDAAYICGDHGIRDCGSCIAKKYCDNDGSPSSSWYRRIFDRKAAWKFVLARDGFKCRWCGRITTETNYGQMTIEHIIPIVRGGTNDEGNLCMAHERCNLLKRDVLHDDPAWQKIVEMLRAGYLPNSFAIRKILTDMICQEE